MCKLLVVFVVFFTFFQKGSTFDKNFHDDYPRYYRADFDRMIGSSGRTLQYFYKRADSAKLNDISSDNLASQFDFDFSEMPEAERDCSSDDPRSSQPVIDDKGSVVLNACYPENSKESATVSESTSNRFETYSGFFLVNQFNDMNTSRHHFWLFMAQSGQTQRPLIVFLHASPHTSLLAHFLSTNTSIMDELKYNFLFIEYKAQFGFNSGHNWDENDFLEPIDYAIMVLEMLDDFFVIFPELKAADVYIAGSYEAGKIAENLLFVSSYDNEFSNKVKGAVITHGALDANLMINYAATWSQNGFIDLHTARFLDFHETLGEAVEKSGEYEQLEYFVSNFLQHKIPEIRYATDHEERISKTIENVTLELFDSEQFKKTHHIGDRNYIRKVSFFARSTIQEYVLDFAKLLLKYKILYCNGQLDNIFTYGMTSEYLKRMVWRGNEKWYHTDRRLWYDDGHLVGYWKNYSNLYQVLVRNTGFSVDLTRPKTYLKMVETFVEDRNPDVGS